MKDHLYYFLSIVCLLIIAVFGCDNKSQNTKLNEANARISKLASENKALQDQNSELLQQHETLLINKEELEERTKKLVDGYGPGIWYMDESTMPVFIKPVKILIFVFPFVFPLGF